MVLGLLQVKSQEKELVHQDSNIESYTIKTAPNVSSDKLLDAIVSEYEGKVVLIDFWATWCAPCLAGIKKMKTIKPQILEKGAVVIYLTDESSSAKLWETKISDIGGIHYRLSREQFEALKVKYDFKGIPTYMLFDKEGNQVLQKSGYPGNDTILEELSKVW